MWWQKCDSIPSKTRRSWRTTLWTDPFQPPAELNKSRLPCIPLIIFPLTIYRLPSTIHRLLLPFAQFVNISKAHPFAQPPPQHPFFRKMLDNMFYGDFHHTKNPLTFLKMLEEALEAMPHFSESKKCEYFYLHCRSGFNAKTWYENLAPSITTSWATLVLHFYVKWLRANPKVLLKVPEIPLPIFCTAMTTPTAIGTGDIGPYFYRK